MHLSHPPEFNLVINSNQICIFIVHKQFFLIRLSHPQNLLIFPLCEVLPIEELLLLCIENLHFLVMLIL